MGLLKLGGEVELMKVNGSFVEASDGRFQQYGGVQG